MRVEAKRKILRDGRCVELRSALPEDAAAVLAQRRQVAAETDFLVRYPDEIDRAEEDERRFLAAKDRDPQEVLLAVFCDGRIVAVAGLTRVGSQAKLRHRGSVGISVCREFWHVGLGTLLMEELLGLAKAAPFAQAELGVYAENTRAIALYRRFGFREWGTLPRAFRLRDGSYHDEVQMVLEL